MTIGVIGAGKMGQALLKGLLACGVPPRALCAADIDPAARRRVARRFPIRVEQDIADVARRSQVLVLAVKPQQFPAVVPALAAHVRPRQLVVSIAAGISLGWLESRLPRSPVVRVMPNLPATVSQAFSALAAGGRAGARHRERARAVFRAVGDAVEVPERWLDAVTAVSGSGPAYVFFLVHLWEEAARALGLPARFSERAIRRTLAGSLRLLEASREPAAALIEQVASKGGTTEAALRVLRERRVPQAFTEALRAAARRAQELSW